MVLNLQDSSVSNGGIVNQNGSKIMSFIKFNVKEQWKVTIVVGIKISATNYKVYNVLLGSVKTVIQ